MSVRVRVRVIVWLGSAAPTRSVRWLDGALITAAKLTGGTAFAAGEATWLDLAADRAARLGMPCIGLPTTLQLDYLGWAQVAAAAARHLAATTVLVDEASRPERFPEVCAIAELLDSAQLTSVTALVPAADHLRATRTNGTLLQTLAVRGPAVLGLRVAGPAIEEYPTPTPSASLRRVDLATLGLEPSLLAHRALPPRAAPARKTIGSVAEHLAAHLVPRIRARTEG